ncbi:hypothetical protein U2F10_21200 [Leptothoe sp. EHU-05/26/07-4]
MQSKLSLAPRYTLDDESAWLIGIDPVRRYWIKVDGETTIKITIPGLLIPSLETLKEAIQSFRSLPVGATLTLPTFTRERLTIHHLTSNLYAIPHPVNGALAWHLFDHETVEAFLLTAHPDWRCAPQDIALGRDTLIQSWELSSVA